MEIDVIWVLLITTSQPGRISGTPVVGSTHGLQEAPTLVAYFDALAAFFAALAAFFSLGESLGLLVFDFCT